MEGFIKRNTILFVYLIILLISFITVCFMKNSIDFRNRQNYVDFSNGWTSNGEEISLIDLYKYDEVTKTIPELNSDSQIYMNVNNINLKVYIDEELVYKYQDYDKKLFDKTPGSYFIKINLDKEDSLKKMVIEIDDVYKDSTGKISNIYFGDGLDISFDIISKNMLAFVLSVSILFIGIILIVVFLISKKFIDVSIKKILYLGLFALMIGLFTFSDSSVIHLINENEYFYNTIAGMCRILLTIPLIRFIGESYRRIANKKQTYFLSVLGIANFILCYTLKIFNILDYHESIFITHFVYIIDIIYLFYICGKSLILKSKREIFHTIGLLFVAVGCLTDLLLFYFSKNIETTLYTRLGVFIFLSLEAFKFYFDFLDKLRQKERIDLLKELAYKDGLTELLNRTSFIEDLKKLSKCKTGLIALYDVNNLKQVNDTYGHSEGDRLIKNVAKALTKNLASFGKCYRIGGDEFVFISIEDDIEEIFNEANEKLIKELKENDLETDSKYLTSIAMGYSIIGKNNNINVAFEKADAIMYKNKRKMKKK